MVWFFCCCILFVVVLCLVCPMLPVSLDYPFSIAASVFSNVYFLCSFFYFTSCGTRFSFDVTEMVLLFVTIRKASSTPWLLIVQGIFKNMFRTNECEVTRLARNISLVVLKKRYCFLE